MADTARSLSDLQALFADNDSGDISPQDLRDYLVSALGGYAEIYVNAGSTAQGSIDTTPVLLENWGTDGDESGIDADSANDKISLDIAGRYLVNFNASFNGDNLTVFEFELYVGGVATGRRSCPSAFGPSLQTTAGISAILNATAGQDLEVYVNASAGSGKSITLTDAQLCAKLIG